MGDTLKILLLLCAVTAVASRMFPTSDKKPCIEGNYNFKGTCFQCTPCGNFMYEQEKCSATSNTVCGWCGKKPNLNEISDEVLASYQTKCLMSSLDFIGMTKLKDELVNVYGDESVLKVKLTPVDDNLIKEDIKNSAQDNFKIAKDVLFNLDDDSQEQELADPTLEEGKDSDETGYLSDSNDLSGDKTLEEETEEDLQDVIRSKPIELSEVIVKKKMLDDTTWEVEEENNSEEQTIEAEEVKSKEFVDEVFPIEPEEDKTEVISEDEDDEFISDKVRAFLIKKGKKVNNEPQEWELNPYLKGATIVSLKEVEKKYESYLPPIPAVISRGPKRSKSSSEESNERDIKWDKWVDDEVKPIFETVEIVEAEDLTQKYEAYEKLPKRISEKAEQELINFFGEKSEEDSFKSAFKNIRPVAFTVIGLLFIFSIISCLFNALRAERRSFTGVPIDSQDYHMILDASKYVEELEKKEKKASRHVHVNPVFDV